MIRLSRYSLIVSNVVKHHLFSTNTTNINEQLKLALKQHKWKQAFRLSHQGNYENRVYLYHYLKQQELYFEAKLIYDTFMLKRYSIIDDIIDNDLKKQRENIKSTHLYYPLRNDSIIIIDSIDKIDIASSIIYNDKSNIIGVDVEWKPVFRYSPHNSASLLQIATSDRVLIFDLLTLIRNKDNDHKLKDTTIDLIMSFFSSSSLTKLGFGFSNEDIKMLAAIGIIIENPKNLLDLQRIKYTKSLNNLNTDGKKHTPSLSGICEEILGKPIYKVFQISDWSKRPLLHDQILYAALDAHVLLGLYDTENQLDLQVSQLYLSQKSHTIPIT